MNIYIIEVCLYLLLIGIDTSLTNKCEREHIIIVVADDLGYNDVSIHGSTEFPTPNFDALALHGVAFARHYSHNLCTPSRSALLTAKYPHTMGMQGDPIMAGTPIGLPTFYKTMPEYFKEMGYMTHIVGKWHLGSHKRCYLPTQRGWDSYFGAIHGYTGFSDSMHLLKQGFYGADTYLDETLAFNESTGDYITEVLTRKSELVIANHPSDEKPLLLLITHNGPHTNNPGGSLMLRTPNGFLNELCHIKDNRRRAFADAVKEFDDSIAAVVKALNAKGMLNCSTIVVFSDNGAPTQDENYGFGNRGSNWPLRGIKMSAWEGAVRTTAAMWSHQLEMPKVTNNLMHITDWLPTLLHASGGNSSLLGDVDGLDQWTDLISAQQSNESPIRDKVVTDLQINNEGFIYNDWKIIKTYGNESKKHFSQNYYGSSGREKSPWSVESISEMALNSDVGQLLKSSSSYYYPVNRDLYLEKRSLLMPDKQCHSRIEKDGKGMPECSDNYCLFNLKNDACEFTNLADTHRDVVELLLSELKLEKSRMFKKLDASVDPRSSPSCWGNVWATWMDRNPNAKYTCGDQIPGITELENCDDDYKLERAY